MHEFAAVQSQTELPKHIEQVRYLVGERWGLVLRPYISKNQTEEEVPFRKAGSYVITGGLGGIGFTLANFLAKNYQAKLVLIGRSSLTTKQQAQVQDLERLGSEAIYQQAEVTQKEDVQALVVAAKQKFGEINGVIHGAGVLRDGLIMNKSLDEIQAAVDPKLYGTLWLDEFTKHEHLDFFALFSSLASVY
ncbi:ketoreductase domain-containing protein [Gracilibacillus saliphilus]|uniref:ketoreductase domain-containing protein n=1 Tax=Gracilibacillus saliphilus TaxID=543890 RepID=UPI0013D42481|nr:ketoreductase domain-containing protein [Gracilibacillus saliphilus]